MSAWVNKMLVAYDGSTPSHKALELARSIAEENPHAEILFVHIVPIIGMGTGAEGALMQQATEVLHEMEDLAAEMPNTARARLLKGASASAASMIIKCAKDEGCDLIIMGSRGQGGVKGYLGSVSYAVVQGSPVAVLIAKDTPELKKANV